MICSCLWQHGSYRSLYSVFLGKATDIVLLGPQWHAAVCGSMAHIELYILSFQGKPLTALCWGHNDMRLFVAAGHNLHVTWVVKHVPKLQYLCQRSVQRAVKNVRNVNQLPLPVKLNENVQALFSPTIKVSMLIHVARITSSKPMSA